MFFRQQNITRLRLNVFHEMIAIGGNVHDGGHFVRQPTPFVLDLGRDVGVQHRPAAFAKFVGQQFDVANRFPSNLTAAGGEFFDGFKKRQRYRSCGAVLNINDQQGRALANACRSTKTCCALGALFLFADNAVPRFHELALSLGSASERKM